jgi:hypothetical protein
MAAPHDRGAWQHVGAGQGLMTQAILVTLSGCAIVGVIVAIVIIYIKQTT